MCDKSVQEADCLVKRISELEDQVHLLWCTISPAGVVPSFDDESRMSGSPLGQAINDAAARIKRIRETIFYLTSVIKTQNESMCGVEVFD